MPRRHGRPLLLAALATLVALAAPAPAAAQLAQLETPDIRIVYIESAHAFLVPHAARSFLNALAFQRALFEFTPSEKPTILLVDLTDTGGGAAGSVPRNNVRVQIAPLSHVFETMAPHERMTLLANHELVHVVTMDQATGRDLFFRRLFAGKVMPIDDQPESILYFYLTSPRVAAPRWYVEGIAVFVETWMGAGLGRAQSGYDEMVFRAMVRDGARFYDPLGLVAEGTSIDFPVKVFLYRTANEMQPAIVPGGGRGVQILGEVVYSDTAMVSADVDTLDITRHEIAHIVTRQATDGPFGVPGWLNEGISVYAQQDPLSGHQAALDAAIRNDRVLTMPELQSSATGMAGLAQGQLNIIAGGVSAGYFNALEKNLPIIITVDRVTTPIRHNLMIRTDLKDQIKEIKDLKGRVIASNAPGSISTYEIGKILARAGLAFTDVEIKNIPFPQYAVALTNKAVDAALSIPPFTYNLVDKGIALPFAEADEIVQPSPMTIAVNLVNTEWAKPNQPLLRNYYVALMRGVRDYCQA